MNEDDTLPGTPLDQLTEHFSLAELTITEHRDIDNTPPPEIVDKLVLVAQLLERIRTLSGRPIAVNSGYRSPAVNAAVGGTSNSQHMRGEAADIRAIGMPVIDLALLIDANKVALGVDQVILEFARWVHVSTTRTPRYVTMTIWSKDTGYQSGIVPRGFA